MRKILLLTLLFAVFASAMLFAFDGADYSGIEWPKKKIPARDGNFEIVDGTLYFNEFDPERLERAFIRSLHERDYVIVEIKPGIITYSLIRNDYNLTMRFCYTPDYYWYEYVSSWNLNAKPRKNKIHKSYYRWIRNLEASLEKNYYDDVDSDLVRIHTQNNY